MLRYKFINRRLITLIICINATILYLHLTAFHPHSTSTTTLNSNNQAPISIAIANLGPHPSLLGSIAGFEDELKLYQQRTGKRINYKIQDVNFDMNQIPTMLASLSIHKPDILFTLTTSVSQAAKSRFSHSNTPIIFADITDPVAAKIIPSKEKSTTQITGASDQQDIDGLMDLIHILLPNVKRIGIPYSPGEANDRALLALFQQANTQHHMNIVPIPIDTKQDIPLRIEYFGKQVDVLYVGAGNMIQPALPAILSVSNRLKIPVFNVEPSPVYQHHAFASYAVSYEQVGRNAAKLVEKYLDGRAIEELNPIYPAKSDHTSLVSRQVAKQLGIKLPNRLMNVEIVE